MINQPRIKLASIVFGILVLATVVAVAGEKPLTFKDLMQFRQIGDTVMSVDGHWVVYVLDPDRGDGEVVVRSTADDTEFRIERGEKPVISRDGKWVAAGIVPTLEVREKARGDDKPKKGLSVLDLSTGEERRIDEVEDFAISDDGQWLAYQRYEKEETPEDNESENGEESPVEGEDPDEEADDSKERTFGTELVLRKLSDGSEVSVEHVVNFAFAESASRIAVTISAPEGEGNGVVVHDLREEKPTELILHSETGEHATNPTWAQEADHLAFVVAADDEGEPARDAEVWIWTGGDKARRMVSVEDAPQGYSVPSVNEVQWSRDGQRLFFGFKIIDPDPDPDPDPDSDGEGEGNGDSPFDPYDVDAILEDREVDVWHWNDPRIISNQKERWEENEKDRVYRAVVHLSNDKVVPLADLKLPEVEPTDNPRFALGRSDVPYLREITWDGRFADLYAVDLATGKRRLMAERIAGGWRAPSASLSPDGAFALYYDDGDWHLFDTAGGTTRNLTADLTVSFADEDWDYPADPPGYGSSEWFDDASAVLIYDKFDIWRAPTDGGEVECLTGGRGRDERLAFRVVDLDPKTETIGTERPFLVEGYHDHEKHDAFFALSHTGEMEKLIGDGNHRLDFVARAEDSDSMVFTRECYDEFPDLRFSTLDLEDPVLLTDANPQIADYAWGAAELVEWTTDDGTPLQGVLIKPDGWEPGTRVPVMVYYYRFFSHRVHLFNEPVVNHRPSFPVYASHGYAVFLPDIKFQLGRPGPSAVECLTSGIEHLLEIGVADPDAVGLHGHSWSGYQTAYVITQTDIFAAAVAGAPVSNMTSAYSGIRWGTGLARQFQYEKSQSRIGGSLWEAPELYIENSPVFFADRINTPLLIEFGDEDEAVPWYQGIELYLACRRLDKDCIMLTYRGEPHHLKQDANKLDYSIKMKQFFDHHLKGEPAPGWMTDGVPYRGE